MLEASFISSSNTVEVSNPPFLDQVSGTSQIEQAEVASQSPTDQASKPFQSNADVPVMPLADSFWDTSTVKKADFPDPPFSNQVSEASQYEKKDVPN